ncbi:MAG: hypothetical protein QXV22_04135 [Thermoplasmataceae archaeon]
MVRKTPEYASFTVGKGKVLVGRDLFPLGKGEFIILDLRQAKGPCSDDSCQIGYELEARLDNYSNTGSYIEIASEEGKILVHPLVYQSIDLAREKVTIGRGFRGKLKHRGFYFCS